MSSMPTFSLRTHADWLEAAAYLLGPLTRLMEPGRADLPLRGPDSNHGLPADRLESFARPCLLAAHWLHACRYAPEARVGDWTAEQLAAWFREGLLRGADPASPAHWGPAANYHQHTVEMGALVLAIEMARDWLWEPFSSAERDVILRWFATARGVGLHRNNHMFFGVLPLEFLGREGRALPGDAVFIDHLLDTLESMHVRDGWFIDGMNESFDYYNAYAFHYYGLWWARLNRKRQPERAARWVAWAERFLPAYAHFFAASGENPPFGRSITYRFAASAPFAMGQLVGAEGISPGQARRICRLNVEYFLNQPILQEQGALSLGWTRELTAVAEAYSCGASPYWAAKGFAPLLLPPDHEFWRADEEPLPAEQADFSVPIRPAGLVVRSVGGAVEIVNAQSMICGGNTKFGVWKWGRLSYRTGAGYLAPRDLMGTPLDATLTARAADGTLYGRHSTYALALEPDHVASLYALGERHGQFNIQVRSYLFWRGPWQLHLHFYEAHQPATLSLGGYSLGADSVADLVLGDFAGENGAIRVAAQPLRGFDRGEWEIDDGPQAHLFGNRAATRLLTSEVGVGTGVLAAIIFAGPVETACQPWEIVSLKPGKWTLTQPGEPDWVIEHPILP